MPSQVKKFQFRNFTLRQKLDDQGIDGNKLFKALSLHLEEVVDGGNCPICGKPFEECHYFQGLDE